MPSRVRRIGALLGVLYALPNLVAVAAAIIYLADVHLLAPPSLAHYIGGGAVAWTCTIVLSMVAVSVLALFPLSPRAMRTEAALRCLTGAFLLGYAVALGLHEQALVTAGFVAAAGIQQFTRLAVLLLWAIPEARAYRVIERHGAR